MNALSLNLRAFAKLNEKYGPDGKEAERYRLAADEIERLRAVIIRAKDALLDGQSTQWVHDVLVAALKDATP